MSVPQILEAGFRAGFTEGLRAGYWIGIGAAVVIYLACRYLEGFVVPVVLEYFRRRKVK